TAGGVADWGAQAAAVLDGEVSRLNGASDHANRDTRPQELHLVNPHPGVIAVDADPQIRGGSRGKADRRQGVDRPLDHRLRGLSQLAKGHPVIAAVDGVVLWGCREGARGEYHRIERKGRGELLGNGAGISSRVPERLQVPVECGLRWSSGI